MCGNVVVCACICAQLFVSGVSACANVVVRASVGMLLCVWVYYG